MQSKPYILIAEDDLDDQELIREAFISLAPFFKVCFYGDGEDLIISLTNLQQDSKPELIILDLNMPRKGGIETLAELKQNTGLAEVPVVIFSTSQNAEDKKKSLSLGADDFVTKPISYAGLLDAVQYIIEHYTHTKTD